MTAHGAHFDLQIVNACQPPWGSAMRCPEVSRRCSRAGHSSGRCSMRAVCPTGSRPTPISSSPGGCTVPCRAAKGRAPRCRRGKVCRDGSATTRRYNWPQVVAGSTGRRCRQPVAARRRGGSGLVRTGGVGGDAYMSCYNRGCLCARRWTTSRAAAPESETSYWAARATRSGRMSRMIIGCVVTSSGNESFGTSRRTR